MDVEGSKAERLRSTGDTIDLSPSELESLGRGRQGPVRIGAITLTPEDLGAIRLVGNSQTGSAVVRNWQVSKKVKEAERYLYRRGLSVGLVTLYAPEVDLEGLVRQLQMRNVGHRTTPRGLEVYGPHAKIEVLTIIKKGEIPTRIAPIRQEFTRIVVQNPSGLK